MSDFMDQIVLVSGATRGIGRAVAGKFLASGAFVWGVYGSDEKAAEDFSKEHAGSTSRLSLVRCDVSSEEQVTDLFSKIDQRHGCLDILVNSAGIRKDAVLALMKREQWEKVMDTNLSGTFFLSKQAVLMMMKKKYGRIINITSPVAQLGFPGQANYAASKAGQIAMSKSLAKEVARKKITVNCVSPGFIDTDFIADLPGEQLQAYKKMIPLRRFGRVEEVAEAVMFLAGRNASYITGTTLNVDGGL
jgi:3-oxoacyl-[acyl-carrier protein] reductase